MSHPKQFEAPTGLVGAHIDTDDNTSSNISFDTVLAARLSRRNILRGSLGTAMTAAFGVAGGLSLTACGGDDDPTPAPVANAPAATPAAPTETLLGFAAVAKSTADAFTVPAGYTASVIIAVGDPLFAGVSAYKNDGTDTDYDKRCGDWHDGMEYFGLSASGARDDASSVRGVLGMNHEWVTQNFLHPNGATANPRPALEVDMETTAMGVSIVEVAKQGNGGLAYVQGSPFNRRVTTQTPIDIVGPAAGHPLLRTKFSADGRRTRGTVNNCGTGKTPWGTYLTGEENWAGFFFRAAGDDAKRSAKDNVALARYGRSVTATAAAASVYGWETGVGGDDRFARWNVSAVGASSDGLDDYRHEMNGQGWITEIDPYNATSPVVKRTALGRMAHEGAAFSKPVVGQPLAVYMGDDSRNEYIYKFVSTATWLASDASASDRRAVGDKYLNDGKLYVAKFNTDGSGQWLELAITQPAIANFARYTFADQGDVLINARLAADAMGATKMDRPEWSGTNPANGEIFITLTNNSNRRVGAVTGSQLNPDAANPRAYSDANGTATLQGNVNGHIVRMKDQGGDASATTFAWDIFLFGAQADATAALVNLSGLTADQDFSSPDGIAFAKSTGLCWVQTDDGAYTDVTNCMMLAAVPGQLGDGAAKTLDYGNGVTVTTRVGKQATPTTLKRFLVGPKDQEITGLAETPDGKVLFVNVQHPGEETLKADLATPAKYTSHWPGNAGYGVGGANARPRSATVMVVKNNGGRVGT
jgi:uncharacterized protein